MNRDFWLGRWRSDQIGFHLAEVNPMLLRYWPVLGVPAGSAVFVPLCGKSLDMRWLAGQGYPVIGVELSPIAVEAFLREGGESCEPEAHGALVRYRARDALLYCGDFFEMTSPDLKAAGGVFDRGALVALPPELRTRYADHLLRVIREGSRILLLTVEYDQSAVEGPPFSVEFPEVQMLYGERCTIERLGAHTSDRVPPQFQARGISQLTECVYRLEKRD